VQSSLVRALLNYEINESEKITSLINCFQNQLTGSEIEDSVYDKIAKINREIESSLSDDYK
jgi:hypothetical protein